MIKIAGDIMMNARMASVLRVASPATSLPSSLREIVDNGFVCVDGCRLIVGLLPAETNVTRFDFHDRTGYECFVNTLHIEDYDDRNPLGQACEFVMRIFDAWRRHELGQTLVAIVIADELSVVARFHMNRPG